MSIQYENGSVQTLLSTGLDSLADGSGALSSAFDNSGSTNLYMWGIFELFINSFGTAPNAGELVEMYLCDSIDGTNYADGSGGVSPVKNDVHYVAGFPVRAVTTDQRIAIPNPISIPSSGFKVLVINEAGQSFPSSGSTLMMMPVRLASS